jgi:hypothetical protein
MIKVIPADLKAIIIIIILMLLAVNAYAGTGNINFQLGRKWLNKSDWEPLENQAELAVKFDYREEEWPVSIAVDYLFSTIKDTDYLFDSAGKPVKTELVGSTTEIAVGVRKIWEIKDSSIRPFLGAGLALISAEVKMMPAGYFSFSDDDSAVGAWLNGGIYWTINKHLNLGLGLRYSQAEVTLYDYTGEAGGFHNGFFLGYHW